MMLWNLIPAPVRVYVLLALATGLFAGGWYANTVWTGYQVSNEKTKVIEDLGKGQTEIINFNQEFDKGAQDVAKEVTKQPEPKKASMPDCMSQPIPNSIRVLLTSH
jgi:hypothetical protein